MSGQCKLNPLRNNFLTMMNNEQLHDNAQEMFNHFYWQGVRNTLGLVAAVEILIAVVALFVWLISK